MSLLTSWLRQPSNSKEPPGRYRDIDASRISTVEYLPLSIFTPNASAVLGTSQFNDRGKDPVNDLSSLKRKENDLQQYLQELLDAQAGELASPAANDPQDEPTSGGDNTHTARNTELTKAIPIRQPPSRPLSLRAARYGIWSTMKQLSLIKNEEFGLLNIEREDNDSDLHHVETWESKRKCLTEKIDAIHNSEHGSQAQQLSIEEQTLQEDINNMETQLNELRSRHRAVRMKLSSLNNSVQAKLSSYKSSMSMLDAELREFLARSPPPQPNQLLSNSSYYSLPAARRTLNMALEHITNDQESVRVRQEAINLELEALEEGSVVWKDVISEITGFEMHLRHEISKFDEMTVSSADHNSIKSTNTSPARVDRLLSRLDQTLSFLESKFRLAEARNWKLLVCCIGAELEACRQGREVFRQTASLSVGEASHDYFKPSNSSGDTSSRSPVSNCSTPPYHHEGQITPDLKDPAEDDEPDPDLLVSHEFTYDH